MFYWHFYDLVNLLELSFLQNVPNFKWNFSTSCFSFGRQSNFGENRFKHPKYGTYFGAIHGEFSSKFIVSYRYILILFASLIRKMETLDWLCSIFWSSGRFWSVHSPRNCFPVINLPSRKIPLCSKWMPSAFLCRVLFISKVPVTSQSLIDGQIFVSRIRSEISNEWKGQSFLFESSLFCIPLYNLFLFKNLWYFPRSKTQSTAMLLKARRSVLLRTSAQRIGRSNHKIFCKANVQGSHFFGVLLLGKSCCRPDEHYQMTQRSRLQWRGHNGQPSSISEFSNSSPSPDMTWPLPLIKIIRRVPSVIRWRCLMEKLNACKLKSNLPELCCVLKEKWKHFRIKRIDYMFFCSPLF